MGEESFFWADRVVDTLVETKRKRYVCEGMWTPSGRFHIGNARPEIFVPYSVRRTLEDRGYNAVQNLVVDDFDGIRKLPQGMSIKASEEADYMGKPCALAPSPLPGHKSWADFFVSSIKESLPKFGVELNVQSAYHEYKKGALNDTIIKSLDAHSKIAEIWNRIAGTDKPQGFLPVQVLCEACGRILSTTATAWDGKNVSYSCECGHSGAVSPLSGKAKLHWRVHWVAFWILNDVCFESAGKDHFSKGGSVDVGRAMISEIFKKAPPYQTPTEFIQLGGAKMAGSVGNVISLEDWLSVAPPDAFRFMNFVHRPNRAIDFSLADNSLPLLMDRFERAERIFYNVESAETKKMGGKLARAYKLSRLGQPPAKPPYQLQFSTATLISQLVDASKEEKRALELVASAMQGKKVPPADRKAVLSKLAAVRNWVLKYAPGNVRISFAETMPTELLALPQATKKALSALADSIERVKKPEAMQQAVFDTAAKQGIQPKELFGALYVALINRERGPKAGNLITALGVSRCVKRLREASIN